MKNIPALPCTRLSFEVIGNRLQYYDGQYLITAWDNENSMPHGRAGVRTYRATADFDDVIITPVPLMELGGGPRNSDIGYFDIVDGSWTTGGVFNIDQSSASGNARILHGGATDDQVLKVSARINSIGTQSTGSARLRPRLTRCRVSDIESASAT